MTTDGLGQVGTEDASIRVALVDDDRDWALMQARLLEARSDRLDVDVHTAPADVLDGLDAVDCVISDYDMGAADGIEFLKRVRRRDPELPFILVTGQGDETTASDAISAGVTDYFVKEPDGSQTAVLVNRIVNAVEGRDAARRLSESQERFAELFDEIPNPMAITGGDGAVVAANPAFERVFGTDSGLPPEVRERPSYTQREVSCETVDDLRTFLYRTIPLTGAALQCHSFVDITDRVRREAALRLEWDTMEAVRSAVFGADTREEVEQAFCTRLASLYDYSLVWIGDRDPDGAVAVRAAAGEATWYLDAVDETLTHDPGVAALATGEPSVATASALPDVWPRSGNVSLATGGAVPLVNESASFGVVAAYATDPDRFDDAEQRLLSNLADLLAYAISSVTNRKALFSDDRVAVTIYLPATEYPVASLFDDETRPAIRVEGVVPTDGETVQHFVTVPSGQRPTVTDVPGVASVRSIDDGGEALRLGVLLDRPTVDSLLVDHGGRIESLSIEGDRVAVTATLSFREDVWRVVEDVTAQFPDASVGSVRTADAAPGPGETALTAPLTDRQREVLETAFRGGYFERPKRRNSDELAATLDITRATFLQHLRTAERKLLGVVLD